MARERSAAKTKLPLSTTTRASFLSRYSFVISAPSSWTRAAISSFGSIVTRRSLMAPPLLSLTRREGKGRVPPVNKRLAFLEKVTAEGTDDPLAWYGLAMEYRKLERWDEALQTFTTLRTRK